MAPEEEIVRHQVTVPVPPDDAFRLFTQEFGTWWPREYSWSGEVMESIGIEPGAGGLCTEFGPRAFRCDWGRVLEWDPPDRLTLAWHIGPHREPQPDPERASTIEIRFSAVESGGTRVFLEHRHFERHGNGADEYRAALDADRGWPWILAKYAEVAEARRLTTTR